MKTKKNFYRKKNKKVKVDDNLIGSLQMAMNDNIKPERRKPNDKKTKNRKKSQENKEEKPLDGSSELNKS